MNLPETLRAYREEHDLSLREMARIVGCSPAALSKIENGQNRPSVYTLHLLSKVLDIDENELYEMSIRLCSEKELPTDEEKEILDAYRGASPIIRQAIKDILHI